MDLARETILRDQLVERLMRRSLYGGRKARSARRRLWALGFIPPERPWITRPDADHPVQRGRVRYRCNPDETYASS